MSRKPASVLHDDQHVPGVLRDVSARVGTAFGLSIARRAQLCADELIATGDEEAIRFMLVEGWERELSRQFSQAKTAARRAAAVMVAAGKTFAEGNGHVATQLYFPIIVPGRPPVPLGEANHPLIAAALDAEEKQLHGRQQNIAVLRKIAAATQPWPERRVVDLLAEGLIGVDELFGGRGDTAGRRRSAG